MGLGLAAGYGMFGWLIGRFLYPTRARDGVWQFVRNLKQFAVGQAVAYTTPAGQRVVITRVADAGTADDFIALSSVCPHLGCQVHWEPQNDRFFCPCHNGVFDPSGNAVSGPPADAGQQLPRYPLQVQNGLLYIEVSTERLV
jgi:cytochrome b6-f complex iron-sulfur subunit